MKKVDQKPLEERPEAIRKRSDDVVVLPVKPDLPFRVPDESDYGSAESLQSSESIDHGTAMTQAVEKQELAWASEPNSSGEEAMPARSGVPIGWYIVSGMVALAILVIGGYRFLYHENSSWQQGGGMPMTSDSSSKLSSEERVALSRQEILSAEQLYAALEYSLTKYYAAENPEDLKGVIRNENRVLPLVSAHLDRYPLESREYKFITKYHSLAISKLPIVAVDLEFKDGSMGRALLEQVGEHFLIDWESERCFQPISVASLIKERPSREVELRALLVKAQHYNFQFSDETKFQSYQLEFRDEDEWLYGYSERGTVLERELQKLLQDTKSRFIPLIVKVRFPDGKSGPRSVHLTEIVTKGWTKFEPVGSGLTKM